MVIVSKETLLYKDNKGNVIAVLNLNRKQLNSRYNISKKLTIKVLQLGKWRYEDLECQSDNIEVYGKKFWENMEETVAYLSLRGISRIEEIPQSRGKISGLKILDLKDCHSLQKLPQKPKSKIQAALCKDDRWFKELMYLDITGCYLLGHLPKWVCELRNLQVLKGTVFNGMILDQFRLKDLSKLEKLRKLSIKIIHSYLFHPEDCNGLKILRSLVVLTIVWGTHKLERKEQSSDNEKSKTTITLNNSIESAQEEHKSFRSRVKNQGSKTEDDIPLLSFPENLEKLAGHQMLSMF